MIRTFTVLTTHPLAARLGAVGRLRVLGTERLEDALGRKVTAATACEVVAVVGVPPPANGRPGEHFDVLLAGRRDGVPQEGLLLVRVEPTTPSAGSPS